MSFRESYDAAFARLSHEPPPSGSPEEAVAAAEARVGTRLPAALREAYLSDARSWLESAGVRPPDRLAVEEGALAFLDGWGLESMLGVALGDSGADDPPVLRGHGMISDGFPYRGPMDWQPYSRSLHGCLMAHLYVHAAGKAMRFRGWTRSGDLVAAVRAAFPEIPVRRRDDYWLYDETIHGAGGQLVVLADDFVAAGVRTAEDARAFEAATGGRLALAEDLGPCPYFG